MWGFMGDEKSWRNFDGVFLGMDSDSLDFARDD
jgi:hypothetical protein